MPSFISRSEQNVVEELLEFSNTGPFGGIQSEVPLDQVEQFGQTDIQNMTLRKSVAETRSGYTILPAYPDPADEDTVGIADFYDSDSDRIQTVMTLTRLLEWDSSTQDWTDVTGTALTGGPFDLFTWTVVNDTLCFCQGIDPVQIWDGTGTSGPAAPGVIVTTTLNAGGAGYIAGDTGTINGGNGEAQYTVLTVDGGGAVLTYILTTPGLNYTTGTAVDTTATSGSGTGFKVDITVIETASVPSKYLMELGTHLVAAYTNEGDGLHTQRVRWSGAGDPTDWTSASSGLEDILGDLGPITGVVKLYQTGYIFSQWGITQMIPTGVGTAPFQFVPLTTRARGNTVPYSLAAAGEEFACYIGKDNVYIFNGTNSEPIGDRPIQNNKRVGARSRIFSDLDNSDPRSVVGYISDTINGQVFPAYWLVMPQDSYTIVWVYNLDEQNWARFTFTGIISTIGRFFQDLFTRWEDLVGTWSDQTLNWDQFPGINPFDTVLLAFNNGVDGNFDFNSTSEQNWSISGVFIMGDVRHQKTIQKFRVCILDNGPVTFTVSLSNASGLSVSQTVTMGNGSGKNISMVFTLKINGIRIYYNISGAAGQDVTLVEFAPMYSTAGEQRGGMVDS